jgi:hypothetical protein
MKRPVTKRAEGSSGFGLLGIILTVLALCGLAAVAIAAANTDTKTVSDSISGLPSLTLPNRVGGSNIVGAAAEIACRTEYATVEQAVSVYQEIDGKPPSSLTQIAQILKDPLTSSHFTISIDLRHPGQVDVATTGHPARGGDSNCSYAS